MSDRLDMTEPDDGAQETAEEISIREGIYGEIKRALIARGIPAAEIAFIHDFPTPARKAQAFADCNAGRIRVMLASTEKAGTGVNMQERLYALHHLDVPWRPSDVEQREGRILRQGNVHKEVHICQYVTEGSFDAYMWQTLESKARFISQIMAGEVTARTTEDVDQLVMTAAQIKAIASGNPQILEKVGLEVELTRLERLYSVWRANRRRMRRQLETLPPDIALVANTVAGHERAIATRDRYTADHAAGDFQITLRKSHAADAVVTFTDRQRAGAHLRQIGFAVACESGQSYRYSAVVGSYRGFEIIVRVSGTPADLLSSLFSQTEISLRLSANDAVYSFNVGESDAGIIQSMDVQLRGLETRLEQARATQRELQHRYEQINAELNKGWEHAAGYQEMKARLAALNDQLSKSGCECTPSPELSELEAETLSPMSGEIRVCRLASLATAGNEAVETGDASAPPHSEQGQTLHYAEHASTSGSESNAHPLIEEGSESSENDCASVKQDQFMGGESSLGRTQDGFWQEPLSRDRRSKRRQAVSSVEGQLSFDWA